MSLRVLHPATSSIRTKPGKPGTSARPSNHARAGGWPRRMSTITSVSTRVIRSTVLAAPDAPAQLAGELHRVADVIPILPGADEPIGPQRLQHLPARPGLILRRRTGGASRDGRLHGLEL